ncbi:MAG: hypothetical protein R2823_07170 [Acidimicrobiia bacterium]
MQKIWMGIAGVLFIASGVLIFVAFTGSSHPMGAISVEAATAPGDTMELRDSSDCRDDFPGWRGVVGASEHEDAAAWFDEVWGPAVEPWTSRSNTLGVAGEWRHYADLSVRFVGDGYTVQTFAGTVDHGCPSSEASTWGAVPQSAWTQPGATCPSTDVIVFAGTEYLPKPNALGSPTEPTLTPPGGWDLITYPNGGAVAFRDDDANDISVRYPGSTVYQLHSVGGICASE